MEVILVYLSCFKFYLDLLVCVFVGRRRRRGRREERGRGGGKPSVLIMKVSLAPRDYMKVYSLVSATHQL